MPTSWFYLADGSMIAKNSQTGRCLRIAAGTSGYLVEDFADEGNPVLLEHELCRAEAILLVMNLVQIRLAVRQAA